ncbi:CheR family methyltransferase [Evansella tamaricis]|uniref:Protein-glutamate O-methyltransferase CheR n=1 Tax=Evansella tamaricis TaxID=2069301 RepID=A0ABS6JDS7_9BACI|nr:protein-glutamate O-methyltransferase CheR [Evansella tamaricis]MBU9711824.1 protein-glutamate O-methyltransferase CheR [Evansella tamaricis]
MSDYQEFIAQIKRKTGIDLSLYKEAQMKRRLTSLRDKRGYRTFQAYFHDLGKNQPMLDEFLQRMTINVSEFFRNPNRWDVLEMKILPRLLSDRKNKLKVWSAACSTGEEPYSVSMLLHKYLSFHQMDILATDLDQDILKRAKDGIYGERALKDVPSSMLQSYFTKEEMSYRVNEDVKKPIRFKQHDLLAGKYESEFDLIICRNVMIYFTEEAKDQLYRKFSKALREGGVLFVGSTEQIFNPQQYDLWSEETFFYKRI